MTKQEWDEVLIQASNAIAQLKLSTTDQNILKYSLALTLLKVAESEELYESNLQILDTYAENGLCKRRILTNEKGPITRL